MRFKDQIATPILSNLPQLTLSWALVAVVAIVAKDENCRHLKMGHSERIVDSALGLPWKNLVIGLMCFYLAVGLFFSLTRQQDRTIEIQNKFLRPIAVPVLFQIAGLIGGLIAESAGDFALLRGCVAGLAIVVFALAVYNFAELFHVRD